MIGSITSHSTDSVLCSWNGSISADEASGSSTMSDSAISWKPRIDEPSNPEPLGEGLLVEGVDREPEVLPGAGQVGELEVHHPHAVLLGEGKDVLGLRRAALDGERRHLISSALPLATPGMFLVSSAKLLPVSASTTAGSSAITCVTSRVILCAPGPEPFRRPDHHDLLGLGQRRRHRGRQLGQDLEHAVGDGGLVVALPGLGLGGHRLGLGQALGAQGVGLAGAQRRRPLALGLGHLGDLARTSHGGLDDLGRQLALAPLHLGLHQLDRLLALDDLDLELGAPHLLAGDRPLEVVGQVRLGGGASCPRP